MADLVVNPIFPIDATLNANDNIANLINQANNTKLRGQDIEITNARQHPDYQAMTASLVTVGPASGSAYTGGTVDFEYLRLDLERVTMKVSNGDPVVYDKDGNMVTTDINGLSIPTTNTNSGTSGATPNWIYDFSNIDSSNTTYTDQYGANVAYISIADTVVEAGDAGDLDALITKINTTLGLVAEQLTLQVQQQPDLWVATIADRDALTYNQVNNASDAKIAETIIGVQDNGSGAEAYFKPGTYSEANNTVDTWNTLNSLPLLDVNTFSDLQVGVSPVPLLAIAKSDAPIYVGNVNIFIDLKFDDLITKSLLNGFAYNDQVYTNTQTANASSGDGGTTTN